ncbi:unnamed protein product [Caenorhabditis sp. 36 PRJEB53466]|nr:unnamed protein product [Caenorhabditis sp. 36 PRJEB53466]
MEYILHDTLEICIDNQMNSTVLLKIYDKDPHTRVAVYKNFANGLTIIPRHSIYDWNKVVRDGLNVSVTAINKIAVGVLQLKWCWKEAYTKIGDRPFTIELTATKDRQIVRYWDEFISLSKKCPPHEETLTDHVWVQIESMYHSDVGEIIAYNCHHTWVLNGNREEIIRITPTLNYEEANVWMFDYVVLPFRRNVHFASIKHLVDTALVKGLNINFSFSGGSPQTVSFSSCYASGRHTLHKETQNRKYTLTRSEVKLLSAFSNVLDCPEEKTHGVYISFGASDTEVSGTFIMELENGRGANTPIGPLRHDDYTTIAFNLKRGDQISRNVHVYRLFSPDTVNYVMSLYRQSHCLSDYQPLNRFEYDAEENHGVYLHVKAIEDSIGYVATYQTVNARILWHQLNEEYELPPYNYRIGNSLRVFSTKSRNISLEIQNLLERVQVKPAVSLRFYIDCSGPCEFSVSECEDVEPKEWKAVRPLHNQSFSAWYSFDKEEIDVLHAYFESENCRHKPHKAVFVHIRSPKNISVRVEFSLANGTDLNQVDPCLNSETVQLKKEEAHLKTIILVIEVATVVIALIGALGGFWTYRCLRRSNCISKDQFQLMQMENVE